jgi:hypothetical protein
MKLFFNSLVLLLLVSSASAKLHEEKIFTEAAGQRQEEGPKFHITRCPNENARVHDEYLLDVAKDVKVRSVIDIFELNYPKGKITRRYKSAFHGFAVSGVTEDQIRLFADGCNKMVVEVLENAKARMAEEWGLDRIDDRAGLDNSYRPKADGAGVSIYIIDTGVRRTHNEFTGRVTEGIDFTGEGQIDGHGHGTHVAGTPRFFTTHLREREGKFLSIKLKSHQTTLRLLPLSTIFLAPQAQQQERPMVWQRRQRSVRKRFFS